MCNVTMSPFVAIYGLAFATEIITWAYLSLGSIIHTHHLPCILNLGGRQNTFCLRFLSGFFVDNITFPQSGVEVELGMPVCNLLADSIPTNRTKYPLTTHLYFNRRSIKYDLEHPYYIKSQCCLSKANIRTLQTPNFLLATSPLRCEH
jgi:hypothetical protein